MKTALVLVLCLVQALGQGSKFEELEKRMQELEAKLKKNEDKMRIMESLRWYQERYKGLGRLESSNIEEISKLYRQASAS